MRTCRSRRPREPSRPRRGSCAGYTGKEDPSRKQVTLSLSVAADGALPAWYQVGDGNAADTQTYLRHLTAVQEYLDVQQPLVVGDSKLISGPNILGFCRARARFLGPTRLKPADRTRLRQLWAAGEPLHRLDRPPARPAGRAGAVLGVGVRRRLGGSGAGDDLSPAPPVRPESGRPPRRPPPTRQGPRPRPPRAGAD